MSAYYNENDPKAAAWLRELIKHGHIAAGDVDERSIEEVRARDLVGYDQCHFFAGIGGWSYALRLAGWPDDRKIWTGSCPCQPFSAAGKRLGEKDERHLWPAFARIISESEPAMVLGEQVASKDGRKWLARVRTDLERMGYVVGCADLCAAGAGAPHVRQRLYWMAHSDQIGREQRNQKHRFKRESAVRRSSAINPSEILADSHENRKHGEFGRQANAPQQREEKMGKRERIRIFAGGTISAEINELGNAETARLQGQWSEYRPSGERCSGLTGLAMQNGVPQWNGPTIAIECSDGSRRISAQPDSFPLAHGVPARVVKLCGSGNAIVPQVAAIFIQACEEALRALYAN